MKNDNPNIKELMGGDAAPAADSTATVDKYGDVAAADFETALGHAFEGQTMESIQGAISRSSTYDELEGKYNALSEESKRQSEADPYGGDTVVQRIAEMREQGLSKTDLLHRMELDSVLESDISDIDLLVHKKVLDYKISKEEARALVVDDYKGYNVEEGEGYTTVGKAKIKVDAQEARKNLDSQRIKFEERAKPEDTSAAENAAITESISNWSKVASSHIPSKFKSIKIETGNGSLDLDVPTEIVSKAIQLAALEAGNNNVAFTPEGRDGVLSKVQDLIMMGMAKDMPEKIADHYYKLGADAKAKELGGMGGKQIETTDSEEFMAWKRSNLQSM